MLALVLPVPFGPAFAVLPIIGGVATLFYFDIEGRIISGDAGAAIRSSVLGYLVVSRGPGLVPWVAGVAITGLTTAADLRSVSG